MSDLALSFHVALELIIGLDADLVEIVLLSLRVTLTALFFAAVIGLPLGAVIGVFRFPGRAAETALFNALMGLPPVVAGLLIYLLLSRAGPLGQYGILYTPAAMVIAQSILVIPIITALTRQTIAEKEKEHKSHHPRIIGK